MRAYYGAVYSGHKFAKYSGEWTADEDTSAPTIERDWWVANGSLILSNRSLGKYIEVTAVDGAVTEVKSANIKNMHGEMAEAAATRLENGAGLEYDLVHMNERLMALLGKMINDAPATEIAAEYTAVQKFHDRAFASSEVVRGLVLNVEYMYNGKVYAHDETIFKKYVTPLVHYLARTHGDHDKFIKALDRWTKTYMPRTDFVEVTGFLNHRLKQVTLPDVPRGFHPETYLSHYYWSDDILKKSEVEFEKRIKAEADTTPAETPAE